MDPIDTFTTVANHLKTVKDTQNPTDAQATDTWLQEGNLDNLKTQLHTYLQEVAGTETKEAVTKDQPGVIQVVPFTQLDPVYFKASSTATVGQLKSGISAEYNIPINEFDLSLERLDGTFRRGRQSVKDDAYVWNLFSSDRDRMTSVLVMYPAKKGIWMFNPAGFITVPVEVHSSKNKAPQIVLLKLKAETPISKLSKALHELGIEGTVRKATIGKRRLSKADLQQYVYFWDIWRQQNYGKVVLYL